MLYLTLVCHSCCCTCCFTVNKASPQCTCAAVASVIAGLMFTSSIQPSWDAPDTSPPIRRLMSKLWSWGRKQQNKLYKHIRLQYTSNAINRLLYLSDWGSSQRGESTKYWPLCYLDQFHQLMKMKVCVPILYLSCLINPKDRTEALYSLWSLMSSRGWIRALRRPCRWTMKLLSHLQTERAASRHQTTQCDDDA